MSRLSPRDLPRMLHLPLSEEQLQAATAPLEPHLIVAGAGTGKTTVMAARVVWLVATDQVRADEVLGLTFTNKAAQELRHRIRTALAGLPQDRPRTPRPDGHGDEVEDPTVMTYNGFAAQLITHYGMLAGVESEARLVTDGQRARLAYGVACHPVESDGLEGTPQRLAEQILALDETCAGLDLDPAEIRAYDAELLQHLSSIEGPAGLVSRMAAAARRRQVLTRLVDQFREAKHAGEWLDFADQVRLGSRIAHDHPAVGAELRRRFRVVLLDEYQDTSRAQRRTLQALFADGHAVTAVGDPCQAIYGWRGASVTNIDEFPHQFPSQGEDAAIHTLSVNRRSLPAILTAANDIAADLRAVHPQVRPLEAPATRSGGRVTGALLRTHDDELVWLGDELGRAGTRRPWSDMAVLCRSNDQVADVVAHLRTVGIPCHVSSRRDLLALPEIHMITSLLRLIVDPYANPEVLHHLVSPRWRIGPRDLATVSRRARDLATGPDGAVGPTSLLDAVRDPGDPDRYPLSAEARERLAAFSAELDLVTRDRSVAETVAAAIELLAPGIVPVDSATLPPSFAALTALAQGFRGVSGGRTLADFVAYLDDCRRFSASPEEPHTGGGVGITVMTMHAAKGLEFPVVAMPFCGAGVFPSAVGNSRWVTSPLALPPVAVDEPDPALTLGFPGTSVSAKDHDDYVAACRHDDRHDEDRLAYVAATRAQEELIVSGHWWGPTQSRPRGPSAYLLAVRRVATDPGPWVPEAGDRPDVVSESSAILDTWPPPVVRESSAEVARAVLASPDPDPDARAPDLAVDPWRVAIDALVRDREPSPPATLPGVMSASAVLQWLRAPDAYLDSLARPMPRRPSRAAATGVEFHTWIEHRMGQQALFEFDDTGQQRGDTTFAEALARTRYADRTPYAVEAPFVVSVADLVVTGRIDAIFAVTDDDRFEWEVVDWKTGSRASADSTQLALYAHAWARQVGCDPRRVRGVFVFLADGSDQIHDELSDPAELVRAAGAIAHGS
ncbi:MAG: ATP-dependent DNA helicase [Candidatus Nanopelagicales bacterium]